MYEENENAFSNRQINYKDVELMAEKQYKRQFWIDQFFVDIQPRAYSALKQSYKFRPDLYI